MQTVNFTRSWSGSETKPGSTRARFFLEPVQDEIASAQAGRPIFHDVERVELFMPGDQWHKPVHNVTDDHRQRYPEAYAAFRAGVEDAVTSGTPLSEWSILSRSRVMELQALGFRSVEDVRDVSDQHAAPIMGMMSLKERAKAWLDEAAELAQNEMLHAENDKLNSEIASLKLQLKELADVSQRMFHEVTALKSATNPLAATIPGMADPLQAAGYQDPRPVVPQQSFSVFSEDAKRRPGRPRKHEEAA